MTGLADSQAISVTGLPMQPRPKSKLVAATAMLLLASLVGVLAYDWFCGSDIGGIIGLWPRLFLHANGYMAVVRQIETGALKPGPKAAIAVPSGLRSVSPDGNVYAERKPDGRVFVLFPIWYGRGKTDLQGYLYCSRPLKAADFSEVDWGSGGVWRQLTICGRNYLSAEHVRGPWWWVWRRVD